MSTRSGSRCSAAGSWRDRQGWGGVWKRECELRGGVGEDGLLWGEPLVQHVSAEPRRWLLGPCVVPSRVSSTLTLGVGDSLLQEIQSLLINWKGPDLTTYGELVLEGTFRVHRVRNEKTFFLFDKALLITKKRGDHFVYKGHIPVTRPPPSPLPPSHRPNGRAPLRVAFTGPRVGVDAAPPFKITLPASPDGLEGLGPQVSSPPRA